MSASNNDKEEELMMPPGFRLHPIDEELAAFYLKRRKEEKPLDIYIMKFTNHYEYDPWNLCQTNLSYFGSESTNRAASWGFRDNSLSHIGSARTYRAASGSSRFNALRHSRSAEVSPARSMKKSWGRLFEQDQPVGYENLMWEELSSITAQNNFLKERIDRMTRSFAGGPTGQVVRDSLDSNYDGAGDENPPRAYAFGADMNTHANQSREVCIHIGETDDDINRIAPMYQFKISKNGLLRISVHRSGAEVSEIILAITGQAGVSLLGYSLNSSSYSPALYFVVAANAIGFIGTLTAISLREKKREVGSILGKVGAIAAASATIVAMGMYLPFNILWTSGVACLIPAVAVAFA